MASPATHPQARARHDGGCNMLQQLGHDALRNCAVQCTTLHNQLVVELRDAATVCGRQVAAMGAVK